METETKPPHDPLDELLQETPREKGLSITFRLRILGFILLLIAFFMILMWNKEVLGLPIFRTIAMVVGGAGVLIYFSTRIYEISTSFQKRRRK